MSRIVAGAVVLAVLAACASLPPVVAGPPASSGLDAPDRAVQDRIRFIEDRLDARRRHAQIWYWGWLIVFGASAVGLSAGAATSDHAADRANSISQAVLAGAGVGDLLLRPLEARFGADPIRALPETTPEQRRQKLERAEAQLRANAERAATRTAWPLHLINAAANGAAGLIVWAAGDGTAGAIAALTGTLGGEAYIWTEPGAPVQDQADYERFRSGQPARAAGGWQIVPALGGLTVRLRF
jgi:hypothetical protein